MCSYRLYTNLLPCTPNTAKKLTLIQHWYPKTHLTLHDVPELFNVNDFCELVKKGIFKEIFITFDQDASEIYINNFKAVVKEMEDSWIKETKLPRIHVFDK